ncbi:MAG: LysM peptidoglycan-binding domain-containing protein [Ilumatobacteraceae bacterium]
MVQRIGIVTGFVVAASLVGAACGDGTGEPIATLPPIATTSTTSTTVYVTTTIVYLKHAVQPGESLFTIAAQYGVSVDELIAINEIDNPDYIQAGQVLLIPDDGTTPSPTAVPGAVTTLANQPGTTLPTITAPAVTAAP